MVRLYQVKASPGKGNSVFARRAITPGTVILTDTAVMEITREDLDIRAQDVQKAFDGLYANEQATFLSLHESTRPLKTRLLRIYKANCFDYKRKTFVFLKISRFNHSCSPNTEQTTSGSANDTHIVALKPIAKGEEILISYNSQHANYATTHQRVNGFRAYFQFTCACEACTLPLEARKMSDGRRQLIRAVWFPLHGQEVPDFALFDAITVENAEFESVRRGVSSIPLRVKMTEQQRCAYNILLAKLFEAEGIVGHELAMAYSRAASSLLEQMIDLMKEKMIIVLDSVRYVKSWMDRAIEVAVSDTQQLREKWENMKQHECVRLGLGIVSYLPPDEMLSV